MKPPYTLRRAAIGADCATWTGLAFLRPDGHAEALPLRWADRRAPVWRDRLVATLGGWRDHGAVIVAIEEPPVTSRAKAWAGSKMGVGFSLGRSAGLVEAAAYQVGLDVVYVEVAAWRRDRDALARRLEVGLPLGTGQGLRAPDEVQADRQKAYGYALAARLWPEVVASVVAAADDRRRAGAPDVQPWRLASVSDACEALLIALSVGVRSGL